MNELYLVDQHAAHEKILFEKYRKSIMNLQVISQILLTPLVLDLGHEDFPYYIENQEVFASCGFDIEVFGGNSIAIREVPMLLGKPNVKDLFYDIIENLKALGSGKTIDVKYDKIASLACKAAVKANDRLSDKEMEVLIEDLRYIDEPFTCPHGRPTIIKIGLQELEKRFKRIQ
ncbi:DNA mismatch repair protein MutL [bioreactor metagenome]|uniref:DNA mismatch repair protein MutL n=1 Tax=bioreactor metagenome TaxID=1076179 RepID=A0A644Z8Q8_9ZZZZ